jgi:hypothetical protein
MKRLNSLELILGIIFIGSVVGAVYFGESRKFGYSDYNGATSVDTGVDGGALGLSLIGATALIGIVWIEITRFKNSTTK